MLQQHNFMIFLTLYFICYNNVKKQYKAEDYSPASISESLSIENKAEKK